ncbi:HesA/MoeB/ThiF family protein [Bythopirellula polymerisocia]|uniref:Molybdopterin-synthase adenylyltransferase n=1 Tax=Bythopirellula polymerisocia TaxID=2528003 RepID=A0A5C6CB53_9BACT|nr:ThiF family adenylyltransferase [Bythopirellula polymerisocia]TWU21312.1 Molybdopterin-synthase adenylyltransferase [Bythopirellula polymerisocia]
MKRALHNTPVGFGPERVLRIRQHEAEELFAHMRQDERKEQMAFGLGYHQQTAQGTIFQVNDIILPDESDLAHQSAGGVTPTREFLSYVYFQAFQTKQDIIEFHTHPGACVPHFSGIDETYAYPNAEYMSEHLPDPITLVLVVGNNRFDAFDAVAWDRDLKSFHDLQRIEVLGRPSEVHLVGVRRKDAPSIAAFYDRQVRIPGWNQQGLAQLRIGIVGMGGNGAHLFQTLLQMGAAEQGFFALVDADEVEASNIPRIPYATPEDVGMPKVTLAAQWAGRRSSAIAIYPYPCMLSESAAQDRLKNATVLFGCVDNDGGRMMLNDLAIRYGIPLIDLGCDVIVEDEEAIVGGQVRVVLPGENACLVCCHGYDPAQAAIDLMDAREHAQRAVHGYVRNSSVEAAPSIANLNCLTAQAAIAQLLAIVNGKQFGNWDYFHFDQSTLSTITASTKHNEECPCCGREGNLGKGYRDECGSCSSELLLTHIEPETVDSEW